LPLAEQNWWKWSHDKFRMHVTCLFDHRGMCNGSLQHAFKWTSIVMVSVLASW